MEGGIVGRDDGEDNGKRSKRREREGREGVQVGMEGRREGG